MVAKLQYVVSRQNNAWCAVQRRLIRGIALSALDTWFWSGWDTKRYIETIADKLWYVCLSVELQMTGDLQSHERSCQRLALQHRSLRQSNRKWAGYFKYSSPRKVYRLE